MSRWPLNSNWTRTPSPPVWTQDEPALAVQSDMQDGMPFVRGTPTFVVLYGGEGRLIPGALPADQFVAALTQMLGEISAATEDGGE